ncbi:hypothetical protein OSTOST_19231, partial [Ostertagia ostertagi]
KVKPIELLEEPEGIVQSDGYPGFAPPFTFQQILIQCSTEQHIHLNISDFDCFSGDKLIFGDGPTPQHPVLQSPCGSPEPVRLFRSESDSVFVSGVTEMHSISPDGDSVMTAFGKMASETNSASHCAGESHGAVYLPGVLSPGGGRDSRDGTPFFPNSDSTSQNDDDEIEGFLCPICMSTFNSPELFIGTLRGGS